MREEKNMKHQSINLKRSVLFWLACGLVVRTLLPLIVRAAPQTASKKPAASQAKPKRFATPQQAAEALIQAAEQYRCGCARSDSWARWARHYRHGRAGSRQGDGRRVRRPGSLEDGSIDRSEEQESRDSFCR